MSEKMVRVQVDSESGGNEFKTVPLSEVPSGYILATMQGFGSCYVDPSKLRVSEEPRHPEFPEAVRVRLRRIMTALEKVQPLSLEEWESGFRCDMHAWREIALYERVADALVHFTRHLAGDDEVTQGKRMDVFRVIMSYTNDGPPPKGYQMTAPATLTDRRVKEIGDWLFSEQSTRALRDRSNELRDLIQPNVLMGPNRVHISALFGDGLEMNDAARFNPRELLASARVIMGVDVDSEREFLVYGREILEDVAASGEDRPVAMLHVELDQDTDELEKLVALVQVVKGRHDYRAG